MGVCLSVCLFVRLLSCVYTMQPVVQRVASCIRGFSNFT